MFLFLFPAPASPRRRGAGEHAIGRARACTGTPRRPPELRAAGPGPGRCRGSRRLPLGWLGEAARDWSRARRSQVGRVLGRHCAPAPVPSSGWAAEFCFGARTRQVLQMPRSRFLFFFFFLNSCSTLEPSLEGSHAPPLRDLCKAALGSH